jgi:Primase C terminal 2 (PriCT-2)/RepB DNA-primase from phage plasmid/Family of unknown function (DUF5906)
MTNRAETEKFLKALEPDANTFTFQTFDESKKKARGLTHVLHGTLAQHWETLCRLNKAGAGIYITVNETDGHGRKMENVTRVRAVFADLDGAPLAPAKADPRPHIIVESSPKHWHAYWRVKDMPLDAKLFRQAQRQLIKRLGSDPAITDLPRVLRLPGFIHQKGKPFRVRLVEINEGKPYKADTFINGADDDYESDNKKRTYAHAPADIKLLNEALDIIPSDEYQIWFEVGSALAHELGEAGFELFERWSRKSEKYNKAHCERKWRECEKVSKFTAGTIFHYATKIDPTWREGENIPVLATVDDFVSFLPSHNYIYLPTGQSWPASSVNTQLPKQTHNNKRVLASVWLDKNRKVQGMTWAPGDDLLIPDRIAREQGGWIEKPGTMCLNLYYPPVVTQGSAAAAKLWVNLVHRIYPDDAAHIINFLAHRVQRPGEKINHALLLGGEPGIGKDSLLEPVKHAIGPWNFTEVSPKTVVSRFNAHIKSVICRISEARDMGEVNRYDFYESLKTLTASPPDVIQCEEKHMKQYAVANVTGIIITTNHKTGGIYLPENDRRTYVAWSRLVQKDFVQAYWDTLWSWYLSGGGLAHVAAYLRQHDISKFNPKAPPRKTEAFLDIVEANLPQEDAEFAEALNILDRPAAITLAMIAAATPSHSFAQWIDDRKNARAIPHRIEMCGYAAVRNKAGGHNRWRYSTSKAGKQQQFEVAIYARTDLDADAQIAAAKALLQQLQRDLSEKQKPQGV